MEMAKQKRKEFADMIRHVLDRNLLAVLATQRGGQPHASLMAFSYLDDLHYLIFATYRDTLKYQSLIEDGRVALLVHGENGEGGRTVITAIGQASDVPNEERFTYKDSLLKRHPDLLQFLDSPNCALVRVAVEAYQVVGGIDDVHWYRIDDPTGR